MSSHVSDRWALELQQFNITFEHIQGKKNMVANAISWLMTFVLYHNSNYEEVQQLLKDTIENPAEEIHSIISCIHTQQDRQTKPQPTPKRAATR